MEEKRIRLKNLIQSLTQQLAPAIPPIMSPILKPLLTTATNYIDKATDSEVDNFIVYAKECIKYIEGEGVECQT